MSEPTTAEMIAWCDSHLLRFEAKRKDGWATYTTRLDEHDFIALRAIAARLRQAAGKAEPAPTFEAAPANVAALAPKRTVEDGR